jgi:hypothetical protein
MAIDYGQGFDSSGGSSKYFVAGDVPNVVLIVVLAVILID